MSHNLSLDNRGILITCPHCAKRNRLAYERLDTEGKCGSCHQALPGPAEPIEITDAAGFRALLAHSALPVLVDFWAPWCPPCRAMAPELTKCAAENAGRWITAKIDTDRHPALGAAHEIQALPTLVVFQNGREIARDSGARPAPTLKALVENAVRASK